MHDTSMLNCIYDIRTQKPSISGQNFISTAMRYQLLRNVKRFSNLMSEKSLLALGKPEQFYFRCCTPP